MKKIFYLLASVLLGACSNNSFPVYSRLDSIRVLALIANTPEVAPGASVTMTPHVSDVLGAGRALKYSVSACPDPGVGAGASPTCSGNPLAVTIADSQSVTALSANNAYTGAVNSFSVNVPANLLVHQSSLNVYNGTSYLVTYQLIGPEGLLTSAFKRILVSQGHALNQNPSLTDILSEGVPLAAAPVKLVHFLAQISAASAESFTYQDSTGQLLSATESLLVTWFSNTGDFQYVRTNFSDSDQFTPGSAPAGGHAVFVAVVRDGRGGEAIIQKSF